MHLMNYFLLAVKYDLQPLLYNCIYLLKMLYHIVTMNQIIIPVSGEPSSRIVHCSQQI